MLDPCLPRQKLRQMPSKTTHLHYFAQPVGLWLAILYFGQSDLYFATPKLFLRATLLSNLHFACGKLSFELYACSGLATGAANHSSFRLRRDKTAGFNFFCLQKKQNIKISLQFCLRQVNSIGLYACGGLSQVASPIPPFFWLAASQLKNAQQKL